VEQPPPEEEQDEQATAWRIYMVRQPAKAGRTKSVVYKDREIAGAAVGGLIRPTKPEKTLSAEIFFSSAGRY
jgi:hypothetical protein